MSAPIDAVNDTGSDVSPVAPSSPADTQRIGDVLVDAGALTKDQLAKLLRIQGRLEDHKPIGQLAIELGMLTRARLDEGLRKHRRGLSLEGILVEKGVIRAEQVAAAREALKGTNKDVARHLVEIGAVSERIFLQSYCEKHGVSFIDCEAGLVDRTLLRKVSIKYLSRQRIVPLSLKEGRLNVVAEDLQQASEQSQPVLLMGASYSLVHLMDALLAQGLRFKLPEGSRIMDTGGFKGQSRELSPSEFYRGLSEVFGVQAASCQNMYGMTELSTQFYDAGQQTQPVVKRGAHWIKTRVLDPLTGTELPAGQVGVLAHTDLGNFNSVLTILTEDLGHVHADGFVLLGRAQGAQAKGCSLAVEHFLQAAQA